MFNRRLVAHELRKAAYRLESIRTASDASMTDDEILSKLDFIIKSDVQKFINWRKQFCDVYTQSEWEAVADNDENLVKNKDFKELDILDTIDTIGNSNRKKFIAERRAFIENNRGYIEWEIYSSIYDLPKDENDEMEADTFYCEIGYDVKPKWHIEFIDPAVTQKTLIQDYKRNPLE